MAAVLACGPDALLSHRSAARLWGLIDWGELLEVTVPGRPRRKRPGITIHSSSSLLIADRASRHAIPVTAVPRTLLDLATVLTADRLERALEAADRQQLLDFRRLDELVHRSHGHRGLRQLIPLIAQYRGAPDVRSDWERDFLDFCRDHRLPLPQTNVLVEGFLVDAYWPAQHLVVELDSYGFHRSRRVFESDHERDARLKLAGYEVLRLTWRQLTEHPAFIASVVRGALAREEGAAKPAPPSRASALRP
jgi:very-short-patch-repair endonuclease